MDYGTPKALSLISAPDMTEKFQKCSDVLWEYTT